MHIRMCMCEFYKTTNLSHLDVQSSAAYFMNMSRVLHINHRYILSSTYTLLIENTNNNNFSYSQLSSTAIEAPRGYRVACLLWLLNCWAFRFVELSSTFLTFQYFMAKIHSIGILTCLLKQTHTHKYNNTCDSVIFD